ncbi:MAG: hypothetical protein WKG07_00410 [Hymenobacter sp.]
MLGLPLELVPEQNPYRLRPGAALTVRVLRQGCRCRARWCRCGRPAARQKPAGTAAGYSFRHARQCAGPGATAPVRRLVLICWLLCAWNPRRLPWRRELTGSVPGLPLPLGGLER